EIDGPDVHRVQADAAAARDTLESLARALDTRFAGVDGVIVEDKVLTLSVHFRLVDDEREAQRVRDAVHACASDYTGVRFTDGRKVVEIRPDVDWHKGRAFSFLRDTLEDRFGPGPAVFIGDDRTDEDVFRVLGEMDCSIIVGDPPEHASVAHASLRSPADVAEFLRLLTFDHA
ncbi:MAG: trehalose-phosphatase, partial [Longimicrobiales bacterium]